MGPLYEQRIRDEVIYLHSLWHQGPPRAPATARNHHLQSSQAIQITKKKKPKRKRGESSANNPHNAVPASHPPPGPEWAFPSPPPSPPPTDGWPSLKAKPNPQSSTLSREEQSKLSAKHAHQRAIRAVAEFFRYNNNADDDSDSIGSSGDESEDLMDEDDGREEYSFFYKVFKEDNELKDYYEKNFARGEFSCLVCGALGGKKMGKKYKGCLALVQHSITIAKTKKRRAHRAFGQAVCKVLAWDINELSSIVSLLSDSSLGNVSGDKEITMAVVDNVISTEGDIVEGKSDKAQPESGLAANVVSIESEIVEAKNDKAQPESGLMVNVVSIEGDTVEGKNDEAVPESGSIGTGTLPSGDLGDMNSCTDFGKSVEDVGVVHNMEESASEGLTNNSLTCTDADKSLEDIGIMHPLNVQEPATEVLNNISLTCPVADQNLGTIGMVLEHELEKPASEGFTVTSLMGPDADQNLENIEMVLPRQLEEPIAEGLTSPNEDSGAGDEIENDILSWLNEDGEN